MILKLTNRVLNGPDRHIRDVRSGLKVVKVRDHLIIYRHGEMKLWVDMELRYVVSWQVSTQAEVTAFNRILTLVKCDDHYEFMRSGRVVLLKTNNTFYRSEDYHEKFGPDSRNYRAERPSSTTKRTS
jgi:hypothetical protein